jgi:phosphoribosylaminoimidazolecarboxamide formyltransferase/IMP cyclohydrolase
VFNLTAAYDAAIARYLLDANCTATDGMAANGTAAGGMAANFPAYYPVSVKKAQVLRYGENGHQAAALYLNTDRPGVLASIEQLGGKELSYNNIRDMDLAWKAVCAYGLPADGTEPQGEAEVRALGLAGSGALAACVAVKHNTPCGIGLGVTPGEAYDKAYSCDPVSIFGGIVASNTVIDSVTAAKLGELFLEIVIAPDFDPDALEILRKKKNLRIIRSRKAPREMREYIAVDGGLLVQESNRKLLEKWEVVTRTTPEPEDIPEMLFGMRAAAYVKSNAIVVVKNLAAIGIGGGETNRIWAAELALDRAARNIAALAEAGKDDGAPARVLASDAFFPFPDVVEAAAIAGIKTIVQVGGSLNDRAAIEVADRLGLAMVLTGTRHFKH